MTVGKKRKGLLFGVRVEVSGVSIWGLARDTGQHSSGFPWLWSRLGLTLSSRILQWNTFTMILQSRHNEPLLISTVRSNLSLVGLFLQWGRTCDLSPRREHQRPQDRSAERVWVAVVSSYSNSDHPLGTRSGLDCSFL